MTQVVIVGAGPTGAALALLLVQRGIAVKLVEASHNFRRVFRGEGLMPSGLNALEQMGLAAILERVPHRALDAWEVWIDQRCLFRVEEPINPNERPCTLVSQPVLLEALLTEAEQYPQFELIQGTPVQDLLWQDQRVAGVKLADRVVPAAVVIGADGRNSIVRQRANLTIDQQPQQFNILWFKMADAPALTENVFYSIAYDRDAFGLFRSSEGNLQIGWALHGDESTDWKDVNWAKQFAAASPPILAEHFRQFGATIEQPVLLSVVVGRCPQWFAPGVLLLGDAAHPMSPIRAQGINMALRDVIVTANHLVPKFCTSVDPSALDAALQQIQAEREPEIIRAQQLQAEEAAQALRLRNSAALRWVASRFAPLIGDRVRRSWLDRQRELRQGITQVQLLV